MKTCSQKQLVFKDFVVEMFKNPYDFTRGLQQPSKITWLFALLSFATLVKHMVFEAVVITTASKTMCFTSVAKLKSAKSHVILLGCWSPLVKSYGFLNISTTKSLKTNCFWEQVFNNHGFYQCRFLKLIEALNKTYVFDHWNHWKVIKN